MDNKPTVPNASRLQLSTAPKKALSYLERVTAMLGELALTLRDPIEPIQQALMAEQLCDLPMEALQFATDRWLKGDTSHLSDFQAESARVGVFMPRASELRVIAVKHLREKRAERRERDRREALEAERRHFREHPEEYEPSDVVQAKITEMNQRLSFNRIIEMPTKPFVEMKREDVMRLSIADLEALIYALRLREAHAAQKEQA